MGARFAKWRGGHCARRRRCPAAGCIDANAHALARYAALCQEAGLVPIVEPEVLMAGAHTLERCRAVTEDVLRSVFAAASASSGVMLEGMILKPNMVLPGLACAKQETAEEVAAATVQCLLRVVPAAVPGIAFLSGGQASELASARLNAMNAMDVDQGAGLAHAVGVGDFRLRARSSSRPWRSGAARWQTRGGAACAGSSRPLQRGRAPRRIRRRNGGHVTGATGR